MQIRKLRDEDIPAILAIYNPYIEKTRFTLEEKPLSLAQFTERTNLIAASFPYLVAEDSGEILGYAYLSLFHERSAYSISCDLSIYVKEGCLRSGIGQKLLDAIIPLAKEKGYENMISLITNENVASIAFHEKNGFLLEGNLKGVARKLGKNVDTLFYRLPLK